VLALLQLISGIQYTTLRSILGILGGILGIFGYFGEFLHGIPLPPWPTLNFSAGVYGCARKKRAFGRETS